MSRKPRLSEDEAREYSLSLSKAAAGDYELMDFAINTLDVPGALGMDASQWVDSIGGYIRMSVEDRREAVRELTDEGKTPSQIATILGISKATVGADKRLNLAVAETDVAPEAPELGPGDADVGAKKKWTKDEIRALIDEGKTDAQIAVVTGLAPDSIRLHYRKPYTEEQAKAKLDARKAAASADQIMSDKEADALIGEVGGKMKKAIGDATYGNALSMMLEDAAKEIAHDLETDTTITDFDRAVFLWGQIGNDLWVYGAKRGFDVSSITEALDRMRGGEDE